MQEIGRAGNVDAGVGRGATARSSWHYACDNDQRIQMTKTGACRRVLTAGFSWWGKGRMMSGRFMELGAGRYTLMVPNGHGPAGIHREGRDVQVDHRGGSVSFEVPAEERVYFWWRGPSEPSGLRIIGLPAQDDGSHHPASHPPAARRPAATRAAAKGPAAKRPAARRRGSRSPAPHRLREDGLGPPDRMSA